MKLGMQVGLGPGHFVLDRDAALPPQEWGRPSSNFRPMSIVAKRSPIWATAEHLLFVYPLQVQRRSKTGYGPLFFSPHFYRVHEWAQPGTRFLKRVMLQITATGWALSFDDCEHLRGAATTRQKLCAKKWTVTAGIVFVSGNCSTGVPLLVSGRWYERRGLSDWRTSTLPACRGEIKTTVLSS